MKNWLKNLNAQKVLLLTLLLAFAYVVIKVVFFWVLLLALAATLYFLYTVLTRPSSKHLENNSRRDENKT